MSRTVILGFVLTLASAFFFAVSGPIAKTMYAVGWTPGAVVLIRLVGAALLLLVPSLIALRGRWAEVRSSWRTVLIYGLVSMAGVQGFYFVAVEHLTVAVALLLEMTAPMLIVFWIWARTRTRPATVTFIGVVISMIGLLLVLNLRGASISILGVVMALAAAVCLASYFLVSAKDTITVPPVALTGLGMGVGALVMGVVVLIGVMPWGATVHDVDFGGVQASWVLPMALIVLFTAGAYITGILGLRYIGATVGSFVNLIEVPFSVAVAWLLLAEMPAPIQLFGGVFILGGVVFIKWGESRLARRVRSREVVARSEAFAEV
ncbi:EamA family transporter [Brevibacterium casei]|uniref:EamA family transporter n=1 Tax=Brevibacterium TaxID=1696 RepID=UPI000B33D826|nr:DMT family transporter [Brevibacterium casei]MCT1550514.1 DMT family transporter [Brevibacterium casei]MCT1560366.1 DMT family transporter [Brevibacterium casei]MCT2182332.1 DMT family transporter [Brevibacterium casei]MCT2209128.1 DMT family transporter [Brevibacterium casei]MDH5149304.1 DMT family transporter [Brevibacterium casei]